MAFVGFVQRLGQQRLARSPTACLETLCADFQPTRAGGLTSRPGSTTFTTPSAPSPRAPVASRTATPPTHACISATAKEVTKPGEQARCLGKSAGKRAAAAVVATYSFALPAARTGGSAAVGAAACTGTTFITSKSVAAADTAAIAGRAKTGDALAPTV